MIEHIRRWNIWRKRSAHSRWYKFMVLIGRENPPSFRWTMSKKQTELYWAEFNERFVKPVTFSFNNQNQEETNNESK